MNTFHVISNIQDHHNTLLMNFLQLFILFLFISSCDDKKSSDNCGINTQYTSVYSEEVSSAGYDIIPFDDCSYIISGKKSGDAWLINIDEEGNELWSHVYDDLSGLSIGNSVNRTSDGGLIIGGGENIIKTDPYGIKEWSYKLPYSNRHYVEDIIQISNGDYIVVGGVGGDPGTGGHNQKGQAYILHLSKERDIQWVKRYGINNSPMDSFWGVEESSDGGFLVVGNKLQNRNFEFYDHFWIVKVDNNGNIEWSHELGGNYWDEAQDIIRLSDNSYIVYGKKSLSQSNLNMWMMRISSSGDILWQTNHGGNNNDTGTAVSISEDENLIVATGYSRTSSGAPFKFKAWGVDATNGDILWNNKYGGDQDDKAYGITYSYDRGFIIVGSTDSFDNNFTQLYIVKIDNEGNSD